jgi:three-Cys-motif partner protein
VVAVAETSHPVSPTDSDLALGRDGQAVRVVGARSREKLFYLARYIEIFTTGMKNRWPHRVYIDLFSGPGRSLIEGTTEEIDGSPLIALRVPRDPFTRLYFNDADPDAVSALNRRIGSPAATIRSMDCNAAALEARNLLFGEPTRTLGLAFIDPTGFQIDFRSIELLTDGVRLDLIVTFMTSYLRRFIEQPSLSARLDAFFGSDDWRRLVDLRERGGTVTNRNLLDLYQSKLRAIGYRHVVDHIQVVNSNNAGIYHLLFATKHDRGDEFFRKISQRKFSGQQRFDI